MSRKIGTTTISRIHRVCFITVFADIFRRDDIGGGAKALKILLIVLVPIFGALVYLIARPRITG